MKIWIRFKVPHKIPALIQIESDIPKLDLNDPPPTFLWRPLKPLPGGNGQAESTIYLDNRHIYSVRNSAEQPGWYLAERLENNDHQVA